MTGEKLGFRVSEFVQVKPGAPRLRKWPSENPAWSPGWKGLPAPPAPFPAAAGTGSRLTLLQEVPPPTREGSPGHGTPWFPAFRGASGTTLRNKRVK